MSNSASVPWETATLAAQSHCPLQLWLEVPSPLPSPLPSLPWCPVLHCLLPLVAPSFIVASSLSSPEGQGEVRSWGTPLPSPFPEIPLVLTFGPMGKLPHCLWERPQARRRLGNAWLSSWWIGMGFERLLGPELEAIV